jgi:hypothetical protein
MARQMMTEQILSILGDTPERLKAWTRDLTAAQSNADASAQTRT